MRLFSAAATAAAAVSVATAALAMAAPARAGVPAAAGPGRMAKGPYLTELSDTGVSVRFELAQPAPARVEVTPSGPTHGASATPISFDSPAATMHRVVLGGLVPATRYAYVVRVGGAAVGEGHWTTPPGASSTGSGDAATSASASPDAPQTFLVYGDDRTDVTAHAEVVRAMMQVSADFLLNTGDMVADGGSAEDWQTFFDVERPLLVDHPLFASIGNHELHDDAAGARFAAYLGFSHASDVDAVGDRGDGGPHPVTPYGTARVGNARFFFLNGMHDWTSGDERTWLERELARADHEAGLVWRFAAVHHGPWSSGPHGGNAKLVAAHIPELLAAHGIDLLFAGHDHIYERGEGRLGQGDAARSLKYVISGGGGAPLYHIDSPTPFTRRSESVHHFVEVTTGAESVRLIVHRSDGSLLERCAFGRGGSWDCDPPEAGVPAPSSPAPSGAGVAGPDASSRVPASSRSFCSMAPPGNRGAQDTGIGWAVVTLVWAMAGTARRRRPS